MAQSNTKALTDSRPVHSHPLGHTCAGRPFPWPCHSHGFSQRVAPSLGRVDYIFRNIVCCWDSGSLRKPKATVLILQLLVPVASLLLPAPLYRPLNQFPPGCCRGPNSTAACRAAYVMCNYAEVPPPFRHLVTPQLQICRCGCLRACTCACGYGALLRLQLWASFAGGVGGDTPFSVFVNVGPNQNVCDRYVEAGVPPL